MYFLLSNLSQEEVNVARKIDEYFKPEHMSFSEKLFNAMLITQHELEFEYFGNDYEKSKILQFHDILLLLLNKFPQE